MCHSFPGYSVFRSLSPSVLSVLFLLHGYRTDPAIISIRSLSFKSPLLSFLSFLTLTFSAINPRVPDIMTAHSRANIPHVFINTPRCHVLDKQALIRTFLQGFAKVQPGLSAGAPWRTAGCKEP